MVPSALLAKARKKYLESGWSPARRSTEEKLDSVRVVPFHKLKLDRREL